MIRTVYALILTLIVLGICANPSQGKIAIVVNETAHISALTVRELEHLYLGKQTTLFADRIVRLTGHAPSGALFCEQVLGLSTRKFRKHWIKQIFAGHRVEPPELFENVSDMIQRLQADVGAIAFVDIANFPMDAKLKIIAIGGLLPDDAEYPLP